MFDLKLFTDKEKVKLFKLSATILVVLPNEDGAKISEDILDSFKKQMTPSELYALLKNDDSPRGFGEIIRNKKTSGGTEGFNGTNK